MRWLACSAAKSSSKPASVVPALCSSDRSRSPPRVPRGIVRPRNLTAPQADPRQGPWLPTTGDSTAMGGRVAKACPRARTSHAKQHCQEPDHFLRTSQGTSSSAVPCVRFGRSGSEAELCGRVRGHPSRRLPSNFTPSLPSDRRGCQSLRPVKLLRTSSVRSARQGRFSVPAGWFPPDSFDLPYWTRRTL